MAMTKHALRDAVQEARRFIAATEKAEFVVWCATHGKAQEDVRDGKNAAQIRRASLDLSVALADLRKGRR